MKVKVTYVGSVRTYLNQEGTQSSSYDVILESIRHGKNGGTYTQEFATSVRSDICDKSRMEELMHNETEFDCEIYFHANKDEVKGRAYQNVFAKNFSIAL